MTSPLVQSDLSDGQWHRMHPLTPVLRGGLTLGVILGVLLYNLRDLVIQFLLRTFAPNDAELWNELTDSDPPPATGYAVDEVVSFVEDPVGWIFSHNAVWLVLLGLIVLLALLIVGFFLSWRVHTFRITGDQVEVKHGIIFRTQRRAPLDRVQGVNLTRPVIARIVGLARLEVIGAGTDSNVKLEYLTTAAAEAVRKDILRLASGKQRTAPAPEAGGFMQGAIGGINEAIHGVVDPDLEPESIVHIPTSRVIGSALLSGGSLTVLLIIVGMVIAAMAGAWFMLFSVLPLLFVFGALTLSQIFKNLRYSIAPTPDGVRVSRGLFTTETEVLPPGRIHAVQISQGPIWRWFGWAAISINRVSGRSASDTRADTFTRVLPVGKPIDVIRVLQVLLPLSFDEASELAGVGLGPGTEHDGYVITPRAARWLRPFSWRRNGLRVDGSTVLLRQGWLNRTIGVFPLARAQGVALEQGPIGRAADVARLRVCTVAGPVYGAIGALDARILERVFVDVVDTATTAVKTDATHRWGTAFVEHSEAHSLPPVVERAAEAGPAEPQTENNADE